MPLRPEDLPNMRKPCADCPFRKDTLKGWLGRRIEQIAEAESFVCHKTTADQLQQRKQCAGHMLLFGENKFVALARSMGIEPILTGRELVFDTPQDCIEYHTTKKY